MSENAQPTFAAAILASGGADKLARKLKVPHKALIELGGKPQIDYVIKAVRQCPELDEVIIVAHESGAAPHLDTDLPIVRPQGESFADAVEAAGEALREFDYLVICTCDAPMLTPEAVSHFVQACRNRPSADLAYSVVKASVVRAELPNTKRTTVNLVEEAFISGCLSAMSRHFLEHNLEQVRVFFAARKSKIALGSLLGWRFVVKLLLKRLSLVATVRRTEEILGCEALLVISPHPGVAFDIDKVSDLRLARQWLADR